MSELPSVGLYWMEGGLEHDLYTHMSGCLLKRQDENDCPDKQSAVLAFQFMTGCSRQAVGLIT